MKVEAARRYFFRATHSLPGFPEPWCHPHRHAYTVELVGEFNHEAADKAWAECAHHWHEADLNVRMADWNYEGEPPDTTVEGLAQAFFEEFEARDINGIRQVTVWEDDDRWGRATR